MFVATPFLFMPTQQFRAIDIPRKWSVYTDYFDVGPHPPYGYLVGEWTRYYDGTYYGWG
jgi:hypothetical protein